MLQHACGTKCDVMGVFSALAAARRKCRKQEVRTHLQNVMSEDQAQAQERKQKRSLYCACCIAYRDGMHQQQPGFCRTPHLNRNILQSGILWMHLQDRIRNPTDLDTEPPYPSNERVSLMGRSDSEMGEGSSKRSPFFHLAALLAILVAAFLADYILFSGVDKVPSLRDVCGSADWIVGGVLLAGGCHVTFLRFTARRVNEKTKSSNRPGQPEAKAVQGQQGPPSSSKLKSALQTLNYQLSRASEKASVQEKLLVDFEAAHGPPDTLSYNLVIRAFAKEGKYKAAGHCLTRMERLGVRSTVCSYNTVLDACAKAGKAKDSEFWLQRMLDNGLQAGSIAA